MADATIETLYLQVPETMEQNKFELVYLRRRLINHMFRIDSLEERRLKRHEVAQCE
jgi:hypothetical protein